MTNKSESIVPMFKGVNSNKDTVEGCLWMQDFGEYPSLAHIVDGSGNYTLVDFYTIQISLDNGTNWATMEEVREALRFKRRYIEKDVSL